MPPCLVASTRSRHAGHALKLGLELALQAQGFERESWIALSRLLGELGSTGKGDDTSAHESALSWFARIVDTPRLARFSVTLKS